MNNDYLLNNQTVFNISGLGTVKGGCGYKINDPVLSGDLISPGNGNLYSVDKIDQQNNIVYCSYSQSDNGIN